MIDENGMDAELAKEISGCADKLTGESLEVVKRIVSNFHFRTMKEHSDGSMGDIQITLKQFEDCLAYVIIHSLGMPR